MNHIRDYESPEAGQWESCNKRMRNIRSYEFDWNDEGASPPGKDVLSLAESVIQKLQEKRQPPPTYCLATDEGHVIFMWEKQELYFEIEIDKVCRCNSRQLKSGAMRADSTEFSLLDPSSTWFPNLPTI
ncbi:MAG: hypothetical protein SGI77_01060 [Pirellulaceae bacterium]|nr:hypothetical protein [Pirellulaceae bacterium]